MTLPVLDASMDGVHFNDFVTKYPYRLTLCLQDVGADAIRASAKEVNGLR